MSGNRYQAHVAIAAGLNCYLFPMVVWMPCDRERTHQPMSPFEVTTHGLLNAISLTSPAVPLFRTLPVGFALPALSSSSDHRTWKALTTSRCSFKECKTNNEWCSPIYVLVTTY